MPNNNGLGVDGYTVVTLAYEQLAERFSPGNRIPVTSVKNTVDKLVADFGITDSTSPAIMRAMETQGLLTRDQKEYIFK